MPAGVAGLFTAFLPASAAVTAVLLGEAFSVVHLLGFGLMGGSLLPAARPRSRDA